MPKAISYIRFSSHIQQKGTSLARQRVLIQRWAEQNSSIQISNLSYEDIAKSGYTGKHLDHGFGQILSSIENGTIKSGDFILVEAIDRIGRLEPMTMLSLVTSIVAAGVSIVTLEDHMEYSRESLNNNSISNLNFLVAKIQQAHDYSKKLSNRISAAHEIKRKNARKGKVKKVITAFWLNSSGEIIPEKGELVKKCIDLYLKGYSCKRIILILRDSYPEIARKHPSTLKRWLSNPALIGNWKTKGEIIQNVFQPLITKPTFYQLQRDMNTRRKEMSPEETYLLSGICICGECGKRFHIRRRKYKDWIILYCNCSQYLKRGEPYCSNKKTWPYEVLMELFNSTYLSHLSDSAYNWFFSKQTEQVEVKINEAKDIEEQIERLLDVIQSTPNQKHALERIELLNHDLEIINDQISELEQIIIEEDISLFKTTELDKLIHYDIETGLKTYELPEDDPIRLINERTDEIAKDEKSLRKSLREIGYRIIINGSTATINDAGGTSISYELIKHSTRFNCYIVKVTRPEIIALDADDEVTEHIFPELNWFLAINRVSGVICKAITQDLLISELTNIPTTNKIKT